MIWSPFCSFASSLLPRALPSGQVCALSSALPAASPGLMPLPRSEASSVLPTLVSGGVPGTLSESRFRASTGIVVSTPGMLTEVGSSAPSAVLQCGGATTTGAGGGSSATALDEPCARMTTAVSTSAGKANPAMRAATRRCSTTAPRWPCDSPGYDLTVDRRPAPAQQKPDLSLFERA